jgi:uncharacterized protein
VWDLVPHDTGGRLRRRAGGTVAPDWTLGLAMGAGGLVGGYFGARAQRHVPDAIIRRGLGVVVLAIGVRYVAQGLG